MSNEAVEQRARQDAQNVNNAESKGDSVHTIGEEVTTARQQLNPSDYNTYLNNLRGQFQGNQPVLGTIDLYDSAAGNNEQRALQAITANDDELYKVLDTYNHDHDNNENNSDERDGKIGGGDIDAFLEDAKEENSEAYKFVQNNPGLVQTLEAMKGKGGEFSKTALLNDLGYDDKSDDEDNSQFEQFQKDHPGTKGVVTFTGANGKPEVIVEPNGVSTGLSYDSNGNINGMNYTHYQNGQPVDVQLTLNDQGIFVDKSGKPGSKQAPFVDAQGNFGFYSPIEDSPTAYNKFTVDSATGKLRQDKVDLNDPTVAIAGLNRPLLVNGQNQQQFKVGRLDAKAIPLAPDQTVSDPALGATSQAGYEINSGDNLYKITRAALNLPENYDGPDLESAIDYLAKSNGYPDRNQIPANVVLRIPPDFKTRPVVVAPAPVPVPA